MTFPSPAQNQRDLGALTSVFSVRLQLIQQTSVGNSTQEPSSSSLELCFMVVPKLPEQNLRGEPSPLASVWGKCPHTARADLGPQLPLTGGVTALVGRELARVPLSCVIIARSVMSSSITALILSIGSFF